MKRLNPDTGKPFVRGTTRADGFLFYKYQKDRIRKSGWFHEIWLRPEKFNDNVDMLRKAGRNYYKNNKNKVAAKNAAWWRANPEKRREKDRRLRANNPAKFRAKKASRVASKLKRTPPWLTKEHKQQIESFYALAKKLSEDTGIPHHVDHIVPLRGKNVSGLHVPWNLRAIPAIDNLIKGNRHSSTSSL